MGVLYRLIDQSSSPTRVVCGRDMGDKLDPAGDMKDKPSPHDVLHRPTGAMENKLDSTGDVEPTRLCGGKWNKLDSTGRKYLIVTSLGHFLHN